MFQTVNLETKSISSRFLIAALLVQLLVIFSLYFGLYVLPVSLVLLGLIVLVMHDLEKSLYLMIFSLAFSQSIPLLAVGGRTVGVSLDYVLLPIMISAWILRRAFSPEARGKTRIDWKTPSLAFIACCFISLAIASFKLELSKLLDGVLPLIAWIEYLILGFIVADTVRSRGQIKKLLFFMLLLASVIALIGIIEYLLFGSPRISSVFGSFFRNVRGNPNVLGAYLAAFAALSTCLLFCLRGYKRGILVAATLILVAALVLTLSRSAWLGFGAAFAFIAIKKRKRSALLLLPAAVVLLLAVSGEKMARRMESVVEAVSSKELVADFSNIDYRLIESHYLELRGIPGYDSDLLAAALRYSAWSNAIDVSARHPVFGSGFLLNKYFGRLKTAENLYLEILAGTGVLGLLAFLWMFARIIKFVRGALRRAKSDLFIHLYLGYLAAIVVLATVSLTGSVFLSPKLLGTFWFLTGLVVSADRLEDEQT